MFRVLQSSWRTLAGPAACGVLSWTARSRLRCEEGAHEPVDEPSRPVHSSLLTCPGNFEDLEDKRSFDVQVSALAWHRAAKVLPRIHCHCLLSGTQVGSGLSAGFIKLLHRHSAPTRAEEAAGVPLLRDPAVLQVCHYRTGYFCGAHSLHRSLSPFTSARHTWVSARAASRRRGS
jgi:hypothetical protein